MRGAILVDDAVKELVVEGGLAERAGEATAVVADKAHHAVESVKPKVSEAAAVAGEAVNKGAYATGVSSSARRVCSPSSKRNTTKRAV